MTVRSARAAAALVLLPLTLLPAATAQALICVPTADATADLVLVTAPPTPVPVQLPQAASARSSQTGEGRDEGGGTLAATSTPISGGATVLTTGTGEVRSQARVAAPASRSEASALLQDVTLTFPAVEERLPAGVLVVEAVDVRASAGSPAGGTTSASSSFARVLVNGMPLLAVPGGPPVTVPGVGTVELGSASSGTSFGTSRAEAVGVRVTTTAGVVVTVGRATAEARSCAAAAT